MFTGIIQAVGRIERIEPRGPAMRLVIGTSDFATGKFDLSDVAIGDSIAVNGVCLTAIAKSASGFEADVSAETLSCTVGLDRAGAEVNLEKSLTLADRPGGHLVAGHVDGVGEVTRFERVVDESGGSGGERGGEDRLVAIRAPQSLAKYIARKGSITVQGVSLTVNRVEGAEFEINLVPHTVAVTTLKHLAPGARVNLEVDLIARYVERMLASGKE